VRWRVLGVTEARVSAWGGARGAREEVTIRVHFVNMVHEEIRPTNKGVLVQMTRGFG
jgi:hypothetical protein